jgi:hypothetical protein
MSKRERHVHVARVRFRYSGCRNRAGICLVCVTVVVVKIFSLGIDFGLGQIEARIFFFDVCWQISVTAVTNSIRDSKRCELRIEADA